MEGRRIFLKKASAAGLSLLFPLPQIHAYGMENIQTEQDVVIIGGSYAGLSAAMALGRSLRRVLLIDSGKPCNRQTPHSHNFITHDGETPAAIAAKARGQVMRYPTVSWLSDTVLSSRKTGEGRFELETASGKTFRARRILLATGVREIFPPIEGIEACWGISVLHCPYCHGYEVRGLPTGILASGEKAFELARLISNWTDRLTVFSNGPALLTAEQREKLHTKNIQVQEAQIRGIQHQNGHISALLAEDGHRFELQALYHHPQLEQHSPLAAELGCELDNGLYIRTDDFMQTSVPGVYAAGDCTTQMRSVALAVAAGGKAGATLNMGLIAEDF